jgi:hypothetical protein
MSEKNGGYVLQIPNQDSLCLLENSVRCSCWILRGNFVQLWGSLRLGCAACGFTSNRYHMHLVCQFLGNCWSGLDELTRMVIAHNMQTLWKADSPSSETMPRISCTANEHSESREYSHTLLCKKHSEGTSVEAQKQTSLQWLSVPESGIQHTQTSVSASGLVQTWVKGCSPLLCVFGWLSIYQFAQRNLADLLAVKIYEVSE